MSDMETIIVREFRDGELVEERTAVVPVPVDPLAARLADLEERIAVTDARLTGMAAGRLAALEERIGRAIERAQEIDPDASSDPGTRGELAKVKQALTPAEPAPVDPESEVV